MKLNNIIFGILFLGVLFQAKAQTALFNVLASKGAVKYIAAGTTEEKPMIIGKKLFPQDKIVVGDNSYLGLAHTGGKTIEIKRAGSYEVSSLSSEIANQNASVSKKYVDFLAGEINNNGQDMAKNKYKYMGVTGSVERGTDAILVYSLLNEPVLNAPVTFKWDANDNVATYKVKLWNIFDEEVFSTETKSNSVLLDLSKFNLAKEKNLFLIVSSKDNPTIKSEKINLKSISSKDEEDINKQVQELRGELKEETALNKYVLANFYAEKGLTVNAIEQFEAAIAMEPEVEDFKVSYGEYLVATKIKDLK
ncbi:MAG TPA: hypothetical protein VK750_08335 [Cytophagaceae bacterium]|jgi:hypothetical protein|nr:hypothetical protein [Cytophagaceae bacterium]